MEQIDLIGYFGLVILLLSFLSSNRVKKLIIILLGILMLLTYSILKPIYPIGIIFFVLVVYVIIQIKKSFTSKPSIKLVGVEPDNSYVKEFINNYKRDIYNYFPFYSPHDGHKHFLVMRDMNLAGIFIGNITDDIFTIEVDYIKSIYRDNLIGNYIFKQNPGFFKKLGIKQLIGKSFHNRHSKYLKKMGFTKTYIDDQLFYVKKIE